MLGNIGSGKTACMVREMALNNANRTTYSNIITKGIPNNIVIKPEMIVKKELIKTKKDGTPIYKNTVNQEFWKNVIKNNPRGVNIVIDEAHSILNSRRSSSNWNVCMTNFLSLVRKILMGRSGQAGHLILCSQIERRLDVISIEMATSIYYHVCHYQKLCKKCGCNWCENNEVPEPMHNCPVCNSWDIHKYNHVIEVWHFQTMAMFQQWQWMGRKTFHKHYRINDIENYFPRYNTLQWDNLLVDV